MHTKERSTYFGAALLVCSGVLIPDYSHCEVNYKEGTYENHSDEVHSYRKRNILIGKCASELVAEC